MRTCGSDGFNDERDLVVRVQSQRDRSGTVNPLEQLQQRGYADKYRSDGRRIYQMGIVFDEKNRNIESFDVGLSD